MEPCAAQGALAGGPWHETLRRELSPGAKPRPCAGTSWDLPASRLLPARACSSPGARRRLRGRRSA
eukprot:8135403-Alexandrium_andersonii.AAC.1